MFGRSKEKNDYSKVSLDDFSDDEDVESTNNGASEKARHQQLMKKQDEGLEMLSQSAERLGKMSMQIHEELGAQNQILDEMESDLDLANDDLDIVTKKTKEFIEFTGGEKNCVLILILAGIALVLFLLILYT